MALSLNKPKLDNLANEIWKSAERLRGKFKAYEFQSVILPIIVIRRLECVLLKWRDEKKAEVLAKRPNLTPEALDKLVKDLELNPKQSPFSNATTWTLRSVYEEDQTLLEANFRAYINGFSSKVDEIIEHFDYRHHHQDGQLQPAGPDPQPVQRTAAWSRPALGPGNGLHLRRAAAPFLGAKWRRSRGTLHPARSGAPDGGTARHPDT
jgi:hypothetical protein